MHVPTVVETSYVPNIRFCGFGVPGFETKISYNFIIISPI